MTWAEICLSYPDRLRVMDNMLCRTHFPQITFPPRMTFDVIHPHLVLLDSRLPPKLRFLSEWKTLSHKMMSRKVFNQPLYDYVITRVRVGLAVESMPFAIVPFIHIKSCAHWIDVSRCMAGRWTSSGRLATSHLLLLSLPFCSCLRTTDPLGSASQTHSVNEVGCRVTIAHSFHDADSLYSLHTLLS